ncbi:tripartite ATP-independent transporter solute receptor, DctP family [Oscillibacter sp. PC13]|uniref:TRAP transporter substrate-binding protein n=1 Tax=Oscillibacter sp. PC13 TaxID=1855299 RepID=UPI0008E4532C|nr:TRAP transporter substrate-binding protein [Oscillibacter sp. PC13]SFP77430.1 tripartite ATP-independent transporter solute receptor, DctP family [Oscillibacter sp. PC13]
MKRWKNLVCVLLAGLLVLSITACGSSDAEKTPVDNPSTEGAASNNDGVEKISWKLAHTCTEDISLHVAAVKMAENIAAATDGNFVIEVFPNSQLGGNRETLEGMQFGTIEMNIPNFAYLGGYAPSVSVMELPYLIDDVSSLDGADAVYNSDVLSQIYGELEEAGFKWLSGWYMGNRNLTTTNRRVTTPADMKGLKIRTMESEWHMAHFNALGANAVPMAFSEVFTALQQGAIDGQENPYCNIYTMGYHEVQKYITETAHVFDVVPLLVSKQAYDSLPEEYQQILVDEAKKITMDEWQWSLEQNNAYKQKILDIGTVECIELSVEERLAFKEAAQSVYDKYAQENGDDLINAIANAQK